MASLLPWVALTFTSIPETCDAQMYFKSGYYVDDEPMEEMGGKGKGGKKQGMEMMMMKSKKGMMMGGAVGHIY